MSNIRINRSVEELINDIKRTKDCLRKTMLEKFLQIKLQQIQEQQMYDDDPSLDGLSDMDNMNNNDHLSDLDEDKNDRDDTDRVLKGILKDQETSLDKLERINQIKAYQDLLEEGDRDKSNNTIKKMRGQNEEKWGTEELYDPRYSKYAEEDFMNNKMMERLNSEIDFRLTGGDKMNIIKPFDSTNDGDSPDGCASYDAINDKRNRYVPKKKLGKRKDLYR